MDVNTRQIRSFIYCQEYDKALNLLCDIIDYQTKQIKELQEKVYNDECKR